MYSLVPYAICFVWAVMTITIGWDEGEKRKKDLECLGRKKEASIVVGKDDTERVLAMLWVRRLEGPALELMVVKGWPSQSWNL